MGFAQFIREQLALISRVARFSGAGAMPSAMANIPNAEIRMEPIL